MTPIIDADAEQVRASAIPPAVCDPIIYAVEVMDEPKDVLFLERQLVLGTKKNQEIAVLIDRRLVFNLNASESMRHRVQEAAEKMVMDDVTSIIPVVEERVILSHPHVSKMFSELMQAASNEWEEMEEEFDEWS